MATFEHPQQNVNMPMAADAVAAARQRATPNYSPTKAEVLPGSGKGARREVRPGEWIDDRKIIIGGPASPSDGPPPSTTPSTVPASYDPDKVYSVQLGKGVVFAGRTLAPGKDYQMAGYVCTEISGSIINATEIGDLPVDPDTEPSGA